ncbi:hypothetical protein SDC9_170729 [bioreactor metagenome]|uniref:Uncharacterized protein n=1 Tax=bioreactor metagenome TaxID=1076179 RepID=A0A645G8V1_9ZZZZ
MPLADADVRGGDKGTPQAFAEKTDTRGRHAVHREEGGGGARRIPHGGGPRRRLRPHHAGDHSDDKGIRPRLFGARAGGGRHAVRHDERRGRHLRSYRRRHGGRAAPDHL